MKQIVAMIGEGSWGTAIAQLLAGNGYKVHLWCHDKEVADSIRVQGENTKYLPGIHLHKNIIPFTDFAQAVCSVRWVFEAIPVRYLRSVLVQVRPCFEQEQVWVVLSKGIEDQTLLFPTQIIDDVFGCTVQKAVFAGPSFAREVAEGAITGVTIGATDCNLGNELQKILSNDCFRAYPTDDLMGVQVGAAFKNVISLGVGMLDGAGYGDNPKAFIFTRGLQEAAHFAQVMGGNQETLYGFSGVGDLVLTSMGKASRNREVGRRIGKGESLDTIMLETGYVAEGINALRALIELAHKRNIKVPICQGIYDVVHRSLPVREMLRRIMQEPLNSECQRA